MREEPTHIFTQVRRPRGADPGAVHEGWWVLRGTEVLLTTRDGIPLAGRINRREITDGLTAAEIAQRLLRNKVLNKSSDFGRRLSSSDYPKIVY